MPQLFHDTLRLSFRRSWIKTILSASDSGNQAGMRLLSHPNFGRKKTQVISCAFLPNYPVSQRIRNGELQRFNQSR
jgi:hypothetical protein